MKTCMQTFYINNKLQYDHNNRGYLNKINQVQKLTINSNSILLSQSSVILFHVKTLKCWQQLRFFEHANFQIKTDEASPICSAEKPTNSFESLVVLSCLNKSVDKTYRREIKSNQTIPCNLIRSEFLFKWPGY